MKAVDLVHVFVIVVFLICRPADTIIPVVPALKTAVEVVSFGIDVYSFFDSIYSDDDAQSTPAPADYDKILNRISERIHMSTETIVFNIELQSYISELHDVAITVKQLLTEMEGIIKAGSKEKSDEFVRRFTEGFTHNKTELYRVKNLLTFSVDVSGISNTLLSLIANEFECGMSQLEEFQNYYLTLVSDVVAFDLLHEKLYNDTLESWKDAINFLFEDFGQQQGECKAQFIKLIKKDFDQISVPSHLFENNQNRYNYRATDVVFASGSYCVWNLKKYENILYKKHEKTATFVFINANENQATHSEERYQKIASAANFKDCFEDTGNILSFFDVLGEDLVFWLMFPTDRADGITILLDRNSSASKVEIVSDNTKYTTLFYVRAQDKGKNASLTSGDFDVMFNEETVQEEDSSGLETWQLGAIIGGSALVLIIIIVVSCYCKRKYC